jgi:uncharacterized protein (TIGR00255 family)
LSTALQSMTGFGAGEATLGEGTLRVELRSVNHRHLDLRVRCAEVLDVAHVVEEQLRARLGRGHVEAQVRWENPGVRSSPLDMARAREVYAALCALRDELNPGQVVPVEVILEVPGMLRSVTTVDRQQAEAAARVACAVAIEALLVMRLREGDALKRDLLARSELLREHVRAIEAERPRVLQACRERMEARIAKLLEGSELAVDPNRLAQELAWFADRSDVAEEITRLLVHLGELEVSLERGGAVGRKLDFLVQELGREINTVGSKANDTLIAQRVVEMKAELERIREQVQNIL